MGLFGKKESTESRPMVPRLPELPRLPGYESSLKMPSQYAPETPMIKEFPTMPQNYPEEDEEEESKEIHQLPSFPTSEVGNKFSQNSIKSAITGNDYDEESSEKDYPELSMIPKLPKAPQMHLENNSNKAKEIESQPTVDYESEKPRSNEPIFIRIDKFEESLKIFDGVKGKLGEIENMLSEVKSLKEKEQLELTAWEESIQRLKHQIEKVDSDIFSKIE